MQKTVSFEKRMYEVRKEISILEWDLPYIQNDELKILKEKRLMQCKRELQELLEKIKLLDQ